jgi:8-oxo-dGTP pyrophosphatase MutT (NUDIX family)
VVFRFGASGPEIALAARRTRRGELAWGLPKGLIEPDETPEEAAVREVGEETGLVAIALESLGPVTYFYVWEGVRIHKVVHFFLMRATGGDIADHDNEMEEVRWFGAQEALARASYRTERQVIERAVEALARVVH